MNQKINEGHRLMMGDMLDDNINGVAAALHSGVDPTHKDSQCMRVAARLGHCAIVKILLEAGADARALNDEALTAAAYEGQADVVQALLDHGVPADAQNSHALVQAVRGASPHSTQVVLMLLRAGADPRVDNSAALQWASVKNDKETLDVLWDVSEPTRAWQCMGAPGEGLLAQRLAALAQQAVLEKSVAGSGASPRTTIAPPKRM